MENLYTPDCIRTFTGIYMNVFEPTLEMICIEDIAHALSCQPRFAGHLPQFYSVAQHSLMCAQEVGDAFQLEALLHDASEAYLMDMPSPIKQRMPEYQAIEHKLMTLIAEKFGFPYPLGREVKAADKRMLQFEWNYIMLKKPSEQDIWCWDPAHAEEVFLSHYTQLITKLQNYGNKRTYTTK